MDYKIMHRFKSIDGICGIFCIMFSIFYLLASTNIHKSTVVTLGAEFMPRIYGIVLFILSCVQIINCSRNIQVQNTATEARLEKNDKRNVFLTFLLTFCYLGIMQIVGFIIASTLYFVVQASLLSSIGSKRRYGLLLLVGALLSIGSYYAFHTVFHISLPSGLLF